MNDGGWVRFIMASNSLSPPCFFPPKTITPYYTIGPYSQHPNASVELRLFSLEMTSKGALGMLHVAKHGMNRLDELKNNKVLKGNF